LSNRKPPGKPGGFELVKFYSSLEKNYTLRVLAIRTITAIIRTAPMAIINQIYIGVSTGFSSTGG
jgi:hypothetical protein